MTTTVQEPAKTAAKSNDARYKALDNFIGLLRKKTGQEFATFNEFMTFRYDERKVREDAAEKVRAWLDGKGEDSVGVSLKKLGGQLASAAMWGRYTPGQFNAYLDAEDNLDKWAEAFRQIVKSFSEIKAVPRKGAEDRNQFEELLEQYFEKLKDLSRHDLKGTAPANSRPISSAFPAAANIDYIPDIKYAALNLLAQQGMVAKPSAAWGAQAYCHWVDELYELGQALTAYFADIDSLKMYEITAFAVFSKYLWNESGEPIVQLLKSQQKVILQGPPGTGKTYQAETRVAKSLAVELRDELDGDNKVEVVTLAQFEEKLDNNCEQLPDLDSFVVTELVQFHASYDYEDFVRGYRARGGSESLNFELVDGPFARMATLAALFPNSNFLLIIDEINRADIARVLGECIYILDRPLPNRAGSKLELVEILEHGGASAVRPRYVPEDGSTSATSSRRVYKYLCFPSNLYILGTMNTADRSLAIIDMALRRRFAFMDMPPEWEVAVNQAGKNLRKFLEKKCAPIFHELNGELLADKPGLQIGHAYFMSEESSETKAKDDVLRKLHHQLVPLLREYLADGHFGNHRERAEELIKEILALE